MKTTSLLILLCAAFSVSAQNFVSTYAGNGAPGLVNSVASLSRFNHPFGMCRDHWNNLYVADADNHCIRKVMTGVDSVVTLAGDGVAGWKDGAGDTARFNSPSDLCVDEIGNVYVSDFANHRIRKITPDGVVTTVAGNGVEGYADGRADTARFDYPRGICIDTAKNLFVADSWNHRIRMISQSGSVSTYAGGGSAHGVSSVGDLVDDSDTAARFYTPSGLAIDAAQNIYVADAYNHRIRKIDYLYREVTTSCGTSATGIGNGYSAEGDISTAQLNTPTALFVNDESGELFISETFSNRISKLNLTSYYLEHFAGSGIADYSDDVDSLAAFNYPRGIVTDTSGKKVYVCDYNNHAIRLIEPVLSSGIKDAVENKIVVHPNPSTGMFWIMNVPEKEVSLCVYDANGKKIFEANKAYTINLAAYPSGVYYLKLRRASGEWNKVLVKQ